MKNILRWVVFIPISLLLGMLAVFPVHWVFLICFDKDDFFYSYKEVIEYSITPFIIGYFFVYFGSIIAPAKNNKVAKILVILWIALAIIASISVINYGFILKTYNYIGLLLGIIGTIIAYLVVSEDYEDQ